MRSTGRAASTKRLAERRINFNFLADEPDRSSSRTRSKGASAAAKKAISWGAPSSRTEKSFWPNSKGCAAEARPSTLTLRSTRSDSMRMVSAVSWPAAGQAKHAAISNIKRTRNPGLVCIVATFAAGYGIRSIDVDPDGAPLSVAHFVRRSISETVHCTQVSHHLLVSAGQIGQLLDFIKQTATCVRHLFHAIVTSIKSFRLSIERIECLIFSIQPESVKDAIKLLNMIQHLAIGKT